MGFKRKIILILALPIAISFYLSMIIVVDKFQVLSEIDDVRSISSLTLRISEVVHEMQKERGSTALFLGSRGTKFQDELNMQRLETDKRIQEIKIFWSQRDDRFDDDAKKEISAILERFKGIGEIRSAADAMSIKAYGVIDYYSETISALLDFIPQMLPKSTDPQETTMMSAYVHFLLAKEYTGVERAILSNAFAANSFGQGMFEKINNVVGKQDAYLKMFLSLASPEQREFYFSRMKGYAVEEAARMRTLAIESWQSAGFGVDAASWFKMQTEKIDLMKEVENRIAKDLNAKVESMREEALTALLLAALASCSIMFIFVFILFFVQKNITRPIDELGYAMSKLTSGKNDVIKSLQKELNGDVLATFLNDRDEFYLGGSDEIGDMVKEINAMANDLYKQSLVLRCLNERLAGQNKELLELSERLPASEKLKSEFLATVTHELKTPLSIAMGYLAMFREEAGGELSNTQKVFIKEATAATLNLLDRINDMLDYSLAVSGNLELRPERFDFSVLIDEVSRELAPLLSEKSINLKFDIALPFYPTADRQRIKQVLMNLLSNAVKFTTQGGEVSVRAYRGEGRWGITVSDTGIGIKEMYYDKIFEPFKQIDSAYSRRFEGTGLGLAICRKIVELHGGKIWVDSILDKGSVFHFTIPEDLKTGNQSNVSFIPVFPKSDMILH